MGAFNWVLIEESCPACRRKATIRCQTHVASSFGGGVESRFQDREYQLGEKMRWWSESDPEYSTWRVLGRRDADVEPDSAEEACYSVCTLCGARLYVVLRFRDLTPIAVLAIGQEDKWPLGYWR